MSLAGKVVIVTGGGSGIGRAIALAFAREGAKVVIAGRRFEAVRAVAKEMPRQGGECMACRADISRRGDVERLFQRVLDRYKTVDVLVNNAGVAGRTPFLEIAEAEWDRVLDINLKGAFLCSQAALRYWVPNHVRGAIVNITSIRVERAQGADGPYVASKAGLSALTQSLAVEFAGHGITVNAVGPGGVPTAIMKTNWSDPKVREAMTQRIPVGRPGSPDDVANAVLFLASDRARYITGQTLYVDGGRLARL